MLEKSELNTHIQIVKLPHSEGLPLPEYSSVGSAGLDLRAAVEGEQIIAPGATQAIPTGIKIALRCGFEAQIRPRSGLAQRYSIGIINSPGTIDSDYRGEVMVLLTNFGKEDFKVRRGDRIAQMVIARYERVEWEEAQTLPDTARGEGGFGHTGHE